jgi:hypothetical protein
MKHKIDLEIKNNHFLAKAATEIKIYKTPKIILTYIKSLK